MKNILITGGSDGIGLAVAKRLAARNQTTLTLVARNEGKLLAALRSLPGDGHSHLVLDLTKTEDVDTLAEHLAARHYDVLINNAGSGLYGKFEELPLPDQLRMMHLNIDGLVALSHHYLCQARSGDALVNITSFLGYSPLPGASVYSATKAFVGVLSETLWWEYRKRNIYVLGFGPGATASNFHRVASTAEPPFPKALMQSPDEVARELLAALQKRRAPRVISGAKNRLLLNLQRMLPRKSVLGIMGRLSPIKNR